MKDFITTKKDFDLFKREFVKWYKKFNLLRYELLFQHMDSECENALAYCETDPENGYATVTFAKVWNEEPTTYMIKRIAFHECMELFLGNLVSLAEERFISQRELDSETHRVIKVLEHVVFNNGVLFPKNTD